MRLSDHIHSLGNLSCKAGLARDCIIKEARFFLVIWIEETRQVILPKAQLQQLELFAPNYFVSSSSSVEWP